ncbi:MAG: hypothetical protein KAT15_10425, partial [Bacteroidales bacterium]|nr:hypothetical protein [Bacteroidales bacterium]
FQIGGLRQVDLATDKIKPFGAVTLGLARFHLKQTTGDLREADEWKFSATLGGGVKIFLHDRIGIRLQARLGLPMTFEGLWVGGGTGGASGGASFRIPIVQLDLSAGLMLRL